MRALSPILAILLGALMVVGGIGSSYMVSSTLSEQRITTPEDACLPNKQVKGPFTAYCQANVIAKHTEAQTGGKTYAELDREDPLRNVAMNASFLQASLFTSILAFGVSAMAMAVGLLFVLVGLGMRDVDRRTRPA